MTNAQSFSLFATFAASVSLDHRVQSIDIRNLENEPETAVLKIGFFGTGGGRTPHAATFTLREIFGMQHLECVVDRHGSERGSQYEQRSPFDESDLDAIFVDTMGKFGIAA